MLYGTLVSIDRSHELMTAHEMNMLINQNILLTTVNIFGYAVDVLSHDLMDNFFSVMCSVCTLANWETIVIAKISRAKTFENGELQSSFKIGTLHVVVWPCFLDSVLTKWS